MHDKSHSRSHAAVAGVAVAGTLLTWFAVATAPSTAQGFSNMQVIPPAIGSPSAQPVDDTLIVVAAPETDPEELKHHIQENMGRVSKELRVEDETDFSVMFVKPALGKGKELAKKIKAHGGIYGVTENFRYEIAQAGAIVNDPSYSSAWNLRNMGWPNAQQNYRNSQRTAARVTIIDSGFNPCYANNEMVTVKQYDCTGSSVVPESPFDAGSHGTAVSSDAGATTDNGALMCGVASFGTSMPVQITMLRITTPANPNTATGTAITNALVWSINNQAARGGQGPVSMSFGNANSPFWADNAYLSLADSLDRQGDRLFVCAGNDSLDLRSYGNGGSMTVVQATNNLDNLASWTNIADSKAAAPGVEIPSIYNNAVALWNGTSMATPLWSGAVSMVMAMRPELSTRQANDILLSTGKLNPQGKIIPQLDKAIANALGVTITTPTPTKKGGRKGRF